MIVFLHYLLVGVASLLLGTITTLIPLFLLFALIGLVGYGIERAIAVLRRPRT